MLCCASATELKHVMPLTKLTLVTAHDAMFRICHRTTELKHVTPLTKPLEPKHVTALTKPPELTKPLVQNKARHSTN